MKAYQPASVVEIIDIEKLGSPVKIYQFTTLSLLKMMQNK